MSMLATGANTGNRMTPSLQRGKSKGNLTPFSMQQYDPDQMALFKHLFSHLGPDSFLSKLAGGDEEMFQQLEAPALKQFSGLQGNIASRFGGMGGRHSSGFQNTMNQASSDFAQQLQAQRMSLQRNALQDLMGMSNTLLQQRPYENFVSEKSMPFWKRLVAGLAGPLASAGVQGAITGGTMGMMNRGGGNQGGINNAMYDLFPLIAGLA